MAEPVLARGPGAPLSNDWLGYRERKKSLSDTQVKLWRQCPRAWYYKYVLKHEDPPGPELAFGRAMHAALELMWSRMATHGSPASLDELWALFKPRLLLERAAGGFVRSELYETQGLRLLMLYRDNTAIFFRDLERERWPKIHTEQQFDDYRVEGVKWPIRGIVDLEVIGGRGGTIVDYKTTGRRPKPDAAKDNAQLLLYAGRYKEIHGELPVSLRQLYMLRKTCELVWSDCRVTQAGVDKVLGQFREMSAALMRAESMDDFPMKPRVRRLCSARHCAYHHGHRAKGPCSADIPPKAKKKK